MNREFLWLEDPRTHCPCGALTKSVTIESSRGISGFGAHVVPMTSECYRGHVMEDWIDWPPPSDRPAKHLVTG